MNVGARERVTQSGLARRPDDDGLFLALAPMDGITDWVYRNLMTRLNNANSGISMCVSEFVRVTRDPVVDHVIERHCPEVRTGGQTSSGTPVFVQLLGGKPEPMAESARRAAAIGAAGIDINFGCPAKTVNRHDGGASLLKVPARVEAVTRAVRDAVPSAVPVTVKIRLGWEDANSVETIARASEQGGADWLTIHGRTRTQLYKPPVDWVAIGRAREAVSMPVVANGDLNTPGDLAACRAQSGCTAFMIGRGAMARPQLFRMLRGHDEPDLDLPWLCGLLIAYGQMLQAGGRDDHAALGRVKQWLRLAAPAFEAVAELFQQTKRSSTLDIMVAQLNSRATAE